MKHVTTYESSYYGTGTDQVNIGVIQVLLNAFFWKMNTHPPPRKANNIEPDTFVT